MASRRTTISVVCVLLLSVLVVGSLAIGSASAAPPPRPVCAACGDAFEQRGEQFGLSMTVTDSTATVTVHENGTATWVVRNTIREAEALQRLRANETLRETVADARYWGPEVRSVSVTDDGVLVARYAHPDFAEQSVGGSLRSGAFTDSYGYRNLEGLGADRLTVVAPEEMRVAQTVPGASVSANRTRTTLSSFDRGGFVTFVPRDATLGGVLGWLAVADLLFPVVVENGAVGVVFPALVLGALTGIGASSLNRVGSTLCATLGDPGRGLTVLGTAGVAVSLLLALGGSPGPGTAVLFGGGVVTAGTGAAWSRMDTGTLTYRRVLIAAVLGWAAASVLAAAASFLFHNRLLWSGLVPRFSPLLALFGLVPAGFALQGNRRWRGVLTTVGAALAVLVPVVPLTDRFVPFGLPLRLAFAVGEALVLVVLGVPFLLVGVVLAADTD